MVNAKEILVAMSPGPAVDKEKHRIILLSLGKVQIQFVLSLGRILAFVDIAVSKVTDDLHFEIRRVRGKGGRNNPSHKHNRGHGLPDKRSRTDGKMATFHDRNPSKWQLDGLCQSSRHYTLSALRRFPLPRKG
jgi:hypothetical protein